MIKELTHTYRFDISTDEQFAELAGVFGHAMTAVEEQGYNVEYNGRTLHHPGQIGVIGRSAIGKSTFFNSVMDTFADAAAQVSEKRQPSHDQSREVLVWKQWLMQDGREVRLQDLHAQAALSHMPDMHLPNRESAGITIFEHVDESTEFCDMVMHFGYDESGRRYLEVQTTDDVAQSEAFAQGFLPEAQAMDKM